MVSTQKHSKIISIVLFNHQFEVINLDKMPIAFEP